MCRGNLSPLFLAARKATASLHGFLQTGLLQIYIDRIKLRRETINENHCGPIPSDSEKINHVLTQPKHLIAAW
jgi:hypothetical protein